MIKVIGQTTDNRYIVSGVYRFSETYGVPLFILLEWLEKKHLVIAWIEYVKEALNAGMNIKNIIAKIEEFLLDFSGKEMADHVVSKLELFLK